MNVKVKIKKRRIKMTVKEHAMAICNFLLLLDKYGFDMEKIEKIIMEDSKDEDED